MAIVLLFIGLTSRIECASTVVVVFDKYSHVTHVVHAGRSVNETTIILFYSLLPAALCYSTGVSGLRSSLADDVFRNMFGRYSSGACRTALVDQS